MDSPIVTATLQAGALSAFSNILAQLITCWRSSSAWHVDTVQVFQFVFFSLLACPPNYIWQSWLEAQYPAHAPSHTPQQKEALVDEAVTEKTNGRTEPGSGLAKDAGKKSKETNDSSPSLNIKNTAIKFALDQTFGAAVNTVLFIAGIALIRGQSLNSIQHDLKAQFWPMIFAGQKLWPLVSILSFTLVPLQYRMLVGSTAGLFWGIYLSLVAGSKT